MRSNNGRARLIAAASLMLVFSDVAHAYVGPGAGLGVIGTVIAFFGAILLAIVGFIWYPIKRLLRKFRRPAEEIEKPREPEAPGAQSGESESISR